MLRLLILIGLCHAVLGEWPCPNDLDIEPCLCDFDDNLNLSLDCSAITSDEQLKRVMSANYPFTIFKELKIIQQEPAVGINSLEIGSLGELSFETVEITGTPLQYIKEQALFNSHSTLVSLTLRNNLMSEFPFESLSNFEVLEDLDVSDNQLPNLPTLSSTTLKNIHAGKNLNLEITESTFSECPALLYININEISLTELPPKIFSFIEAPVEIHIAGNQLEELDDLSVNPKSASLQRLDFSDNQIYKIRTHAIAGLKKDEVNVYLKNNQITELDEEIWTPIFKAATAPNSIDLSGNDLNCGCDVKWIVNNADYWAAVSDDSKCGSGGDFNSISADIINQICP